MANLPERFRVPFLHCYTEGKSVDEAAGYLRCCPRTLKRRLHDARERLRRRGISLSAAVLSALLLQPSASAQVPATPGGH